MDKKTKKSAQVQEITMDELKSLIGENAKGVFKEMREEIKNELKGELQDVVKTNEEKALEKGAQFVKDVINGIAEKAIDTGTDSFGYSIPTELSDYILKAKGKIAKMRKYAFVFSMSGPFQVPIEGTGITGYWVDDNDTVTESNPTLSKKTLNDYYLAARVLMPRRLLNTSAFNIVNYVGELAARQLRNKEESAFVAGDGDDKPTGLRSAGVGEVAQEGSSLAYSDIVSLFFTLKEQYRENAIWLTSATGMQAIYTIKDENGVPIFDANSQMMFRRPVVESEDIPSNLGSGSDETEIYFGDMWYYWIKDGETMFMDTDKVLSKLQTELVVAQAVDGVYTLPEACKKLTGVK